MRVRHNRSSADHDHTPPAPPRLRLVGGGPRKESDDGFGEERRMRDAGGPDDTATYHCGCGYVFEAHVTTSVTCPNCGSGQAW